MRLRVWKTLLFSLVILMIGFQFNAYRFGAVGPAAGMPVAGQSSGAAAAAAAAPGAQDAFSQTLAWVEQVGYLVLFVAMLIEGPIVNAAAAFAAALGFFNIWIVVVLAILSDIVGDLIYYTIGHFARRSVIVRFGHHFGLTQERMRRIERLLHAHPGRTLIVLKLMPLIPTPGLMVVGATGMPLWDFIFWTTCIIVPKAVVFSALGYYFGAAYGTLSGYIENGELLIAAAVIVVLGVWWAYNKSGEAVAARLETV